MRMKIDHGMTREKAREKVEQELKRLETRYGNRISDFDSSWSGDRLHFSFKASGLKGSGTLEVTERELVVEGKLPLMALPFEGKIRTAIEKEAKAMLGQRT